MSRELASFGAGWERALQLKPGSIGRAYQGGYIERLDGDLTEPYADLSDPHERAIWEMNRLSLEDRQELIRILRSDRADREDRRRRTG